MNALFVYGTLRPGHANAHILENIGGEWQAGFVTGTFYERGWGLGRGGRFSGDSAAPGRPTRGGLSVYF